jgi:hypothetical protein
MNCSTRCLQFDRLDGLSTGLKARQRAGSEDGPEEEECGEDTRHRIESSHGRRSGGSLVMKPGPIWGKWKAWIAPRGWRRIS